MCYAIYMKTWGIIIAAFVVVTAGVGFGTYKLGEARAISANQQLLNHCLDVADKNRESTLDDITHLTTGPTGLSADEAVTMAQEAQDTHRAALAECQVRYPVR